MSTESKNLVTAAHVNYKVEYIVIGANTQKIILELDTLKINRTEQIGDVLSKISKTLGRSHLSLKDILVLSFGEK